MLIGATAWFFATMAISGAWIATSTYEAYGTFGARAALLVAMASSAFCGFCIVGSFFLSAVCWGLIRWAM